MKLQNRPKPAGERPRRENTHGERTRTPTAERKPTQGPALPGKFLSAGMQRLEDFVSGPVNATIGAAGTAVGAARAYAQAPWRKQIQLIGLFSLVLVILSLVAGIYLSVSARTTAVGRDIQGMYRDIDILDQEIEDLQGRAAFLNSSAEMAKRARELGFKPLNGDQVVYLQISGYIDRQPAVLAPYTNQPLTSAPGLPPEYTETLFDWFIRQVASETQQTAISGPLPGENSTSDPEVQP